MRAPDRLPFVVGPPAVPLFNNGTFPAGFLGYPSGFTLFGATPVAGAYTLTVVVPGNSPSAGPVATKTATATLTSVAGLPAEPIPLGVASDGAGGVTVTVGPPPAGATHQVLYVVGVSASTGSPTFYTARADSAGTYAFSTAAVGPQNAQGQHQPLFGAGDSVYAYAVGADYDVLALGPPGNVSPSPALPAQADVTVSPVYEAAYATAAGPLARRRTR